MRPVVPDTAMRLARYFGGDARSWLNLQTAHDLDDWRANFATRISAEPFQVVPLKLRLRRLLRLQRKNIGELGGRHLCANV